MTIDTPNADTSGVPGGEKITPPAEPSWWLDEGVPGVGDRPAWLAEKFKNAAELARGYSELEKRVGTAPDSYDFTKSKYLDPEYAPFKELQDFAKTRKVPQDVLDKFQESMDKYLSEFSTNEAEEIEKLGENSKERLQTLNNWAEANLTPESYQALTQNLRNAESIKALEELRTKMMTTNTVIPNGNEGTGQSTASLADLQQELNSNLDKYKTDPKWRKDYQARLEAASNVSGFVDKKY